MKILEKSFKNFWNLIDGFDELVDRAVPRHLAKNTTFDILSNQYFYLRSNFSHNIIFIITISNKNQTLLDFSSLIFADQEKMLE